MHSPEGRRVVCPRSGLSPPPIMAAVLIRYVTSRKHYPNLSLFEMGITISVSAVRLLTIPCRDTAVCAAPFALYLPVSPKPVSPTANNFYSQSHSHFKLRVLCNCRSVQRGSLSGANQPQKSILLLYVCMTRARSTHIPIGLKGQDENEMKLCKWKK